MLKLLVGYLGKVQWKIKFADVAPKNLGGLGSVSPVKESEFSPRELRAVIKRLKPCRSPGADGIPGELWRVLAESNDAISILLSLCNKCWVDKCVPAAWRHATVVCLFKKVDTSLPSYYRLVSLLNVAYKVMAALAIVSLTKVRLTSVLEPERTSSQNGRSLVHLFFQRFRNL